MRYFRTKRGVVDETAVKNAYELVCGVKLPEQEFREEWDTETVKQYFLGIEEELTDVITPELCLDLNSPVMAMKVYAEHHKVSIRDAKNAVDRMRQQRAKNRGGRNTEQSADRNQRST